MHGEGTILTLVGQGCSVGFRVLGLLGVLGFRVRGSSHFSSTPDPVRDDLLHLVMQAGCYL